MNFRKGWLCLLLAVVLLCTACGPKPPVKEESSTPPTETVGLTVDTVPPFSGTPYVILGDNRPTF